MSTVDPNRAPGARALLAAYRQGYFPMAESRDGPILWYSPDPRAILPLDAFHVPRSLRQRVRKGGYDVRIDTSFETVMRHCAHREETWISEAIIEAYTALHRQGSAHSVETWIDGRLAGGLYGVALGGAFFGESMISLATGGSGVALVFLIDRLRAGGFALLDVQFMTPHLARFGAIEIPRREYLTLLQAATRLKATFRGPESDTS